MYSYIFNIIVCFLYLIFSSKVFATACWFVVGWYQWSTNCDLNCVIFDNWACKSNGSIVGILLLMKYFYWGIADNEVQEAAIVCFLSEHRVIRTRVTWNLYGSVNVYFFVISKLGMCRYRYPDVDTIYSWLK